MEANEFVPIRVSTLRGDLKIPFDVYVRVAGKHILYCRQGDSFEGQRLSRLKEKKLKKLFIITDHEGHYRSYLTESINQAFEGSKGKPIETRAQVIQGAQQAAAEDVMEDPDSPELYKVAKEGSTRFVDFLLQNQEAIRAIIQIENSDQSIGHHGVNVATLAVGIAEKLGYTETQPMQMNTLALGCLLHDIEHQFTEIDLTKKPKEMKSAELQLYRAHPEAGALRLQGKQHLDPLVLKIIKEHEERINGSGFPKGLNEKDIDSMVTVAATANTYDRLTSLEGQSHKDALKMMLIEDMGRHPLENLKALQSVLKDRGILT